MSALSSFLDKRNEPTTKELPELGTYVVPKQGSHLLYTAQTMLCSGNYAFGVIKGDRFFQFNIPPRLLNESMLAQGVFIDRRVNLASPLKCHKWETQGPYGAYCNGNLSAQGALSELGCMVKGNTKTQIATLSIQNLVPQILHRL